MKLSEVSQADGIACAHLIGAVKMAKYSNLSTEEMENLLKAKAWLHKLALEMAGHLKQPEAPKPAANQPSEGFKIKAMGPLPGSNKPKSKSKKK